MRARLSLKKGREIDIHVDSAMQIAEILDRNKILVAKQFAPEGVIPSQMVIPIAEIETVQVFE